MTRNVYFPMEIPWGLNRGPLFCRIAISLDGKQTLVVEIYEQCHNMSYLNALNAYV